MLLNDEDRNYLNEIFTRAYKKYFAFTTDYTDAIRPSVMTMQEALVIAEAESEQYNELMRASINANADAKIARIAVNYENQVLSINTESAKRGLSLSTIVLAKLNQVLEQRQNKESEVEADRALRLAKFEIVAQAKIEKLAKKMVSDSIKANVTLLKEAGNIHNKSLKEAQNQQIMSTNMQKLVDEEVFAQYLRFLLRFPYAEARSYLDDEVLFGANLSPYYFDKLVTEIEKRS